MPEMNKTKATPKAAAKPKLTNRGPAGLLKKLPEPDKIPEASKEEASVEAVQINKISPGLRSLVVPIDSITIDPLNARQHPERNRESIRKSLEKYGQTIPLVARKETRVVIVGNGRLEEMRGMGWTEVAVNFVDLSEADAMGLGLTDNRTAELARWDFEMVARIDQLKREQGDEEMIGWSIDELEVLRIADWTPPAIVDDEQGASGTDGEETEDRLLVRLTEEQRAKLDEVIEAMRNQEDFDEESDLSEGGCIERLCAYYLDSTRSV